MFHLNRTSACSTCTLHGGLRFYAAVRKTGTAKSVEAGTNGCRREWLIRGANLRAMQPSFTEKHVHIESVLAQVIFDASQGTF